MPVNVNRQLHRERLARESPLLRGWGEIGAFLKVSEDTARNYGRMEGLPVFKQRGSRNNASVVAYRDDVLKWFKRQYSRRPFAVPDETRTLPTDQKLREYRRAIGVALKRLQRMRLASSRNRTSSRIGIELTDVIKLIHDANLQYATGEPE